MSDRGTTRPREQQIESVLGTTRRGRFRGRWLVGVLVVLGLVIAAWYWATATPGAGEPIWVTAPVTRGDLTVTVTATGTAEPTNLVEISSELSGTVRAVLVDYNDAVTVGQPLAQLDTDKLEATLAHSRATLQARFALVEEAKATVDEARLQYERIKSLADQKIASTQSLEAAAATQARANAALLVTRAEVAIAEASLRIDETNLSKACICSPIDGVILERNVDVGQIVASSLQAPVLFTIAEDLKQMELRVDIDEADVGRVKVGHPATFTVEAYQDRRFPAEIAELRFMSETIDGVVTYKAILSIDNSELLLRPGMTATAEITVEEVADALLVPNAALRFSPPVEPEETGGSGGGLLGLLIPRPPSQQSAVSARLAEDGTRTLWTLKGGVATPIEVRPGATDGLMTVIPDGALEPGDLVITDMAEEG